MFRIRYVSSCIPSTHCLLGWSTSSAPGSTCQKPSCLLHWTITEHHGVVSRRHHLVTGVLWRTWGILRWHWDISWQDPGVRAKWSLHLHVWATWWPVSRTIYQLVFPTLTIHMFCFYYCPNSEVAPITIIITTTCYLPGCFSHTCWTIHSVYSFHEDDLGASAAHFTPPLQVFLSHLRGILWQQSHRHWWTIFEKTLLHLQAPISLLSTHSLPSMILWPKLNCQRYNNRMCLQLQRYWVQVWQDSVWGYQEALVQGQSRYMRRLSKPCWNQCTLDCVQVLCLSLTTQ